MTKEELIEKVKKGEKKSVLALKKAQVKHSDPVSGVVAQSGNTTIKADGQDVMTVKVVINTTDVMDSHSDVHLPGIWNKSLSDRKSFMLLKEHKLSFENIISDTAKAEAAQIGWKQLGIENDGVTEALVFTAEIDKDRNPYMFKQYANGHVKNHSVGMQYVKIDLAINDESLEHEYGLWTKYIDQILNKEEVIEQGYFFPVFEAKILEGSAVPIGSNWITPTLEAVSDTSKIEPSKDTRSEFLNDLLTRKFDFRDERNRISSSGT
jgi:hypothetical protein